MTNPESKRTETRQAQKEIEVGEMTESMKHSNLSRKSVNLYEAKLILGPQNNENIDATNKKNNSFKNSLEGSKRRHKHHKFVFYDINEPPKTRTITKNEDCNKQRGEISSVFFLNDANNCKQDQSQACLFANKDKNAAKTSWKNSEKNGKIINHENNNNNKNNIIGTSNYYSYYCNNFHSQLAQNARWSEDENDCETDSLTDNEMEESVESEIVIVNKACYLQNKKAIFCQYTTISRNVIKFLQLSQLIVLQFLCLQSKKMVDLVFKDKKTLDLSEYYAVIGTNVFDNESFFGLFLPKWKNVETLALRYCSHLKCCDLKRILLTLTMANNNDIENGSDKYRQKNRILKDLNLYFCNNLTTDILEYISSNLGGLEKLNIGRCYGITSNNNYTAFRQLIGSPVKSLTISLDPSILTEDAMDIVSDLTHKESFPNLEFVDLSYGCQILNEIDLCDLEERLKILIKPKKS